MEYCYCSHPTKINDLKAKIVKLEAQLHKDASNSSIPSSKDDNHKIIPNSRVKTGLKPGGQLGHIGHKRKQYVPDIVKELEPNDYIVNDPNYVKTSKKITKQVVDISLNVKVTEYIAYIYKNKVDGSFSFMSVYTATQNKKFVLSATHFLYLVSFELPLKTFSNFTIWII